MIATLGFVSFGMALVAGGWYLRNSPKSDERIMAAIFIVGGVWQLAGAPMWGEMLMGTFR